MRWGRYACYIGGSYRDKTIPQPFSGSSGRIQALCIGDLNKHGARQLNPETYILQPNPGTPANLHQT